MHNNESTNVRNPRQEIEWPIVWLFSPFHRKHTFVLQKILETKHIDNDAIRLTRRARALHKDSTWLPCIHIKSRELTLPIVTCWTKGLSSAIMHTARKGELRDDEQSLHERDVAVEMSEAKISSIAVDSSAERQRREFVMCAIIEIHAEHMYDERERHAYNGQSVMKCCFRICQEQRKTQRRGWPHLKLKLRTPGNSHKTCW